MIEPDMSGLFSSYEEYVAYQVTKCQTPIDHPYYQGVAEAHRTLVELFLKDSDREATEILDCGCGYGFSLSAFRHFGFKKVLGTDVSEFRLSEARAIGYPVENIDMHEMSILDSQQFDVVYSSHSMEHALYPDRVLNEIWRVLKTDGVLLLTLPYPVALDTDHVRKAHCGAEVLGLTQHDEGNALVRAVERFGFVLSQKKFGSYRDEAEIYLKFFKRTSHPDRLVAYGPASTREGVPFNEQPDGSSALWFELDGSCQGEWVVEFDGVMLKTARSGNLVTAVVPTCLLGPSRIARIRLIDEANPKQQVEAEFRVERARAQCGGSHFERRYSLDRRPNFFMLGAPRCGTTSMYWQLRAHPEIYMAKWKEPFFFDSRAHGVLTGAVASESDYFDLFRFVPFQAKAIGEASTMYLSSPEAMSKIKAFNSEAKALVMLRNPVHASVSMYLQTRKGGKYEQADSFENAWRACFSQAKRPFMVNYPELFSLGEQLANAMEIFGPANVKVIIFDDLIKDSRAVCADVLQFLDLNTSRATPIPKGNSAGWTSLNNHVSDCLRNELIDYFRPQIQLLSSCLGRNLDHWLTPQ
jgi:SAM-dependent methyltransferase